MKKNKFSFRIRPLRIAAYVLWLALVGVLFAMFRSYLLLLFGILLVVFPFISIISGIFLARNVSLSIGTAGVERCTEGEDITLVLSVRDRLLYGTLDAVVSLEIYNSFVQNKGDEKPLTASMPVVGTGLKRNGTSEMRVPFTVTRIGHYMISAERFEVQDFLGWIRMRIAIPTTETEFMVLPRAIFGEDFDSQSISAGMTEVEESNRRGNDFSEVTEIREYREGDRIRDIHWKFSARQEELMVKVRTQMAGMELVVLLSLDVDREYTEAIVKYAYSLLRTWAVGESEVRLLVYRASESRFDTYHLGTAAEVDASLSDIMRINYHDRLAETPDALDKILRNFNPYLSAYISIGFFGGEICYRLVS